MPFAGGAVVSGGAVVVGNGIVDVLSGGTANIAFLSTGSGGLEIADTSNSRFTGTISGFGGVNHTNHKQFIDLVSVTPPPTDQLQLHVRRRQRHADGFERRDVPWRASTWSAPTRRSFHPRRCQRERRDRRP